ncbi:MAG: bifunctional diguanylate cyclase/phosphodiesterase [Lachnospiraceae bacterium]|nr:bifunctional diguanylate cyclase/phosphodiesterase [Lachnospiraceae bacterium]
MTTPITYQVNMLQTLNDKLMEEGHVSDGMLSMSQNAYFYINYHEASHKVFGAWEELTGVAMLQRDDPRQLINVVDKDYLDRLYNIFDAEKTGQTELNETIHISENHKWIEVSVKVLYDDNSDPAEKFVCFKDITAFKKQNEELKYIAYYDSLTGLLSRNNFVKSLSEMVDRAKDNYDRVSLILCHLCDYDKLYNGIGLIKADEVIQQIGQFIYDMCAGEDNVITGHFSTSTFAVAIYDSGDDFGVNTAVGLIGQRCKKPFVLSDGDEIFLSVNFAVSNYPEAGISAFSLLEHDEVMLYSMKEAGVRDKIQIFDDVLMSSFLKELQIEKKLDKAVKSEEFFMFYQPQYYIKNGTLRGCEALIRWKDRDGSFIGPDKFIPIAERNGDILAIGRLVVDMTFRALSSWQEHFGYDGIMSINISPVQLSSPGFVQYIINMAKEYSIEPDHIELELTETAIVKNEDEARDKIEALREVGFKIALDDFGTGYSSLSYLKNMKIDTLKLDKSFIDSMISDDSTAIITESVVSMVMKLGLETIAEGVENKEQYDYLKKINCNIIQGYLLGKPMQENEFKKVIDKQGA